MGPNPYWAMFLNRVRHLGELSLQLWLGRTSCAVCLGIYVQKLASGVFESHALSSASPMSGNREVSATGGERVASARAVGNRSRESRSVMWTPGSLSGGEALAFGSLAATPS